MTNTNLLTSKMALKGCRSFTTDIMLMLKISWSSASQKINGKVNFTQAEIATLTEQLELSGDEVKEIFAGVDSVESERGCTVNG